MKGSFIAIRSIAELLLDEHIEPLNTLPHHSPFIGEASVIQHVCTISSPTI